MDIILIPGLWLDASIWDAVSPLLAANGHRPRPLTLPGMNRPDASAGEITLADQVAAVIAAIDATDPQAGPVALVGHSAGCGIVHAAVDARPDRVARAIHIGGFPTPDGETIADAFPVRDGVVPLPRWSEFSADDLADLDDAALARFRERAIPVPARVLTDRQRLGDPRRYDVPVSVICPEFRSEDLRGWIAAGHPSVAEFARIGDVRMLDLPTGHWPQLTRPAELAAMIVSELDPKPKPITAGEFQAAAGVQDWRVLYDGAYAFFAAGSFARGVALVDAVSDLAEQANHHPDVDLRYRGVTVRLTTHEVGGLSDRDLALARRISDAAGALGIGADPAAVQVVEVTIDALVPADVLPFWRAVLGYRGTGTQSLIDPRGRGPTVGFQQMDAPRPQRNRVHLDISVPHDQAEARIAAALAAGGRLVTDAHAPKWWVLADAEGNEACIATWVGR